MQKPSIPKGTRDFSPAEMVRRNYIFDSIRKVFQLYGYLPIETPAMENLSTLLGKYGEEGDKLLFRILNSGDFISEIDTADLEKKDSATLASKICEKGLRYDLTVPFARYVVQYRNDIAFPFKRYQIQPVWRADRPQKGRYREFYQCDVDVIGSDALLNEVELIQMIVDIFEILGISIAIKLNNRKILAGIAEIIGEADKMVDITVAIDKLEKIGLDKVNEELSLKGVSQDAITKLQPVLALSGNSAEKLSKLENELQPSETGLKGISEMRTILQFAGELLPDADVELDLTLARGLNYYTGAIIEVKAKDVKIGSICGGGRYDDLTGIFGMPGTSGVGISFGADRIYDVMNELNLFPSSDGISSQVLFVNFGDEEQHHCLKLIRKIRQAGINAELFPESAKMKKQLTYADKKQIPFVILIGKEEISRDVLSVKNMKTGEQTEMTVQDLIQRLHVH
ncbi:MAG: histidine--tRNA ligase [Bacteroidales bacterium]|nr:histidine--tRNA ligase [Bacteroidales bacterium]